MPANVGLAIACADRDCRLCEMTAVREEPWKIEEGIAAAHWYVLRRLCLFLEFDSVVVRQVRDKEWTSIVAPFRPRPRTVLIGQMKAGCVLLSIHHRSCRLNIRGFAGGNYD